MTDRTSAAWPLALAVGAMLSVPLGSALSVGLIDSVGAAGIAWLRLSVGAVILLAIARPTATVLASPRRHSRARTRHDDGGADHRLPHRPRPPTAGNLRRHRVPRLTVAAVRSHTLRALIWPGLALAGVVLLTEPWHGNVEAVGIAFAVIGAAGWGCSILLAQQLGDRFDGLSGLALTVPVAAAAAASVGVPEAAGHLTLGTVAAAAGLALLLPVIPYAFELVALRRLTATAFSTLMALEPAIGLLLGLIVLHQTPSVVQLGGIVLVVIAGAAAQRGGRRPVPATQLESLHAASVSG